MILSQVNLRAAVKAGEIVFDPPLEESQWGEASVDLRFGFSITKLEKIQGMTLSVAEGLHGIAKSGFYKTKQLKRNDELGEQESHILKPGGFILGMTYESITVPKNLIALIEGRSTYARVGLSMHQTAPWIQPGWNGPIILEIMNNGPLDIRLTPLVDRPCQLTFFELKTELPPDLAYGAKPGDAYQHQSHPLKHDAGDGV
jgi:dCTP deaminase